MSASGIRMGRVYVEIGADQKALDKAIANVRKQLSNIGSSMLVVGASMAAVGGVAVTGMVAATKAFATTGSALLDMSKRTGVAVEDLSRLGFAAEQSGGSFDDVSRGILTLNRVFASASNGSQAAANAFSEIGLSVGDLSKMNADQRFMKVVDALNGIQDPAIRAAAAMKLFGKSGVALLPMIAEGTSGIQAMAAEARRLGIVMSTEDAIAANAFESSLATMQKAVGGVNNAIGTALAPALTSVANAFSEAAGRASEYLRKSEGVVRVALVASSALFASGIALRQTGILLKEAADGFAVAGKAGSALLAPMRLLFSAGTALGQSFLIATSGVANFGISAAVSLAGILGPIGLLVVAIAGIGVAIAAQSGQFSGLMTAAQNALQPIVGMAGQVGASIVATFQAFVADASVVFGDLWDIATTTFQGIADAMAAGDLAGAAEMLWLGVQAAWQRGTAAIMSVMDPFITDIQNTWTYLATEAANATDNLWSVVQQGFNTGVAAIGGIVDNLVTATMNSFDYLVGEIQKSWNYVQSFFREGFDLKAENEKVDSANAARKRNRELSNPGMEASMQAAGQANARLQSDTQARAAARNAAADATYLDRQRANQDRAKQRQSAVADTEDEMKRKSELLADQRAEFERERKNKAGAMVSSIGGDAKTTSKAEVAGSFSAAAAGQIAFGKSMAQQQLDQLRRIADGVDNLDPALVGD